MKGKKWVTIAIIVAVIILAFFLINKPLSEEVSKSTAQCIGENSELYIQLGCHACEIQEELFGENAKYLTIIDCFFQTGDCSVITHTPTWIINGEKYIGVQNLEILKGLTGCN